MAKAFHFFNRSMKHVCKTVDVDADEEGQYTPEAIKIAATFANDWKRRCHFAPYDRLTPIANFNDSNFPHVDPDLPKFPAKSGALKPTPYQQYTIEQFDKVLRKIDKLERKLSFFGKGVFNRQEAATYLGISLTVLHQERKAFRIKAIRLTKGTQRSARVGFLRRECDMWLEARLEVDPTKAKGVDSFLPPEVLDSEHVLQPAWNEALAESEKIG